MITRRKPKLKRELTEAQRQALATIGFIQPETVPAPRPVSDWASAERLRRAVLEEFRAARRRAA